MDFVSEYYSNNELKKVRKNISNPKKEM